MAQFTHTYAYLVLILNEIYNRILYWRTLDGELEKLGAFSGSLDMRGWDEPMKEWHCEFMGQIEGPFSEDKLREMIQKGTLNRETLVWNSAPENAEKGWVKAAETEISSLFQDTIPLRPDFPAWRPSPIPDYAGGIPMSQETFTPTRRFDVAQTRQEANDERLASAKMRFLAFLADTLIFSIVTMLFMILCGFVFTLVFHVFSLWGFAYDAISLSVGFLGAMLFDIILLSRNGQTIGKKISGVRVVKTNGKKVSMMRNAALRIIFQIALLLPPFVILDLCFMLRQDRRTLHDLIAGTIVVSAK
jgi:uncharacterized RDD family membrane protein YckC